VPDAFLRGRRTNSPSQFGQTFANFSAHSTQNVHSNEQIKASPPGETGRSQCMHLIFISNAIFASPCSSVEFQINLLVFNSAKF
jgi:hypothetical protein